MKLTDNQLQIINKYGHCFVNDSGIDLVKLLESYFTDDKLRLSSRSGWHQLRLLQNLVKLKYLNLTEE